MTKQLFCSVCGKDVTYLPVMLTFTGLVCSFECREKAVNLEDVLK